MYLQLHSLPGGDLKRPNILMLASSTLLFVMVTSVSRSPPALEVSLPRPHSHRLVILAMGCRGFSCLRGCRVAGGSNSRVPVLCRPHSEEADCCHCSLRVSDNHRRFHSCELSRPSDCHPTPYAGAQVYRLYHVWKPRWWICIIPSLAWVGVVSKFRSIFTGRSGIQSFRSVSSSMLTNSMANPNLSSGVGVFQHEVKRWITVSFAFTIS